MTGTLGADALVSNRAQVVRTLRKRLRRFEAHYELRSGELDREIAAGRLRETADVARWLVSWRSYQRLVNTRTATDRD